MDLKRQRRGLWRRARAVEGRDVVPARMCCMHAVSRVVEGDGEPSWKMRRYMWRDK